MTTLHMTPDWISSSLYETGTNIVLATIDSDIAAMPTNEFASVFAGGIIVMFGGLFSALIVGFIVDKRNLYANIVAESYVQGGDEEFWKGLSEEEKKKTQALLQQLNESKGIVGENIGAVTTTAVTSSTSSEPKQQPQQLTVSSVTKESDNTTPSTTASSKQAKPIGMFSDYGDD